MKRWNREAFRLSPREEFSPIQAMDALVVYLGDGPRLAEAQSPGTMRVWVNAKWTSLKPIPDMIGRATRFEIRRCREMGRHNRCQEDVPWDDPGQVLPRRRP